MTKAHPAVNAIQHGGTTSSEIADSPTLTSLVWVFSPEIHNPHSAIRNTGFHLTDDISESYKQRVLAASWRR